MLINLFEFLENYDSAFSVFSYLTLRGVLAMLTALLLALFFGPKVIRYLTLRSFGEKIREDGPQRHFEKSGTPTMGGLLILLSTVLSTILWADLENLYIWIGLFTILSFSLIGFYDDIKKIKTKTQISRGLKARQKFLLQITLSLILGFALLSAMTQPEVQQALLIPYLKDTSIFLNSFLYLILVILVLVGSSNAVNLTDGLDGLATMPVILVATGLSVLCYVSGNIIFSSYLQIPYVAGSGEVLIISLAIAGACLGFLWFNTYPAQIFMGDVGSLGLGAGLGYIALVINQEIVFMIMAGIFVLEALSVIIQVSSFKLTGKRVFRMAPIHHHFELKGWPEPKIIVRFWIITVILVLIGLASLKIR